MSDRGVTRSHCRASRHGGNRRFRLSVNSSTASMGHCEVLFDLARPTNYCRRPLANHRQRFWQGCQQSYPPSG